MRTLCAKTPPGNYRSALGFAALLSLLAGSPALATTITNVELYDGGETVTFGYAGNGSNPYGVAGESGLAGQIILTNSAGGTVDAWCIDLFHDVYLGSGQNLTYTGEAIANASNGDGGTLTGLQASEVAGLVNYGNALIAAGGATLDQSAGIQMAIWSTELPGLTFTGPSAAVTDWDTYVSLAPTLAATVDVEALVSLTGTQELAAYDTQIPEPSSLLLLGFGILLLAGLNRQKTAGWLGAHFSRSCPSYL